VNNFGHLDHSAEEVFEGTRLIIDKIEVVFPNAKILLMGVFPFEQHADHPMRERVKRVNMMSASLADNERVFFLDIGEQFLEPDGSISPDMMSDFLHLNPKGYKIWFDAVYPVIQSWLNN
jgi:lysophospholipase L1-like esterase